MENTDELQIHKETDHLEFKCDKCAFASSTSRILDDHKVSMHVEISIIDEPEEINQCAECDVNFASTHDLSLHK